MRFNSLKAELSWVSRDAGLKELMERYPELWANVGPELVATMEDGRATMLEDYANKAKSLEEMWHGRIRKSRDNAKVIESALPFLIKSRMKLLSLEQCYQAAATGKASGRVRLNLINGYIIQKLLFRQHLTRKPASLKWFHFWWRFVSQKRLLMPLVQPKGIYCFYSVELIKKLHDLIEGRSCLEIAAGDGTLARFLSDTGVQIHATDNYGWNYAISYPNEVEKLGAKQALDKYQPQAVICSWPPPGNTFEQRVFATRSVELYIVVGSRHRFAAGNWDSYEAQDRFEWCIDRELSSLVIPPELESAVLIFRRKPAGILRPNQ
jgi:hypothetical protein